MAWKKAFNAASENDKPAFANVASPLFFDRYGNAHDSTKKPLPIKERLGAFAVIVAHGHILLNFPPWAEYCRDIAKEAALCAELPGGGVKIHETVEEGLLRELQEETGLRFKEDATPSPVLANEFYMNLLAEDVDTYYRYLQKFYCFNLDAHLCQDDLDGIKLSDDGSRAFWQPLDKLDDLVLRFGHEHIIREATLHECKPENIARMKSSALTPPAPCPKPF
jgi:8-oxo-dGTP pyrophosphatase MutT (NUDIX family)